MSTLFITEYAGTVNGRAAAHPVEPPIASQALTFTTSAASDAFNAGTGLVRIASATACHVAIGAAPTATTSLMYLAAGESYLFQPASSGLKVAAVDAA